ncbi:MAG: hypothetical protein JW862_02910 [Anaerolineales bacterium]|nr:hypothetical protein [Anaerolineales bacterium]
MKNFLLLSVFLLLLSACGRSPAGQPDLPEPVTAEPFRIIAYVTDAIVPDVIRYDLLTHINYAFLIPNADGTFRPLANGWKLAQVVEQAHARDVKVLISVGGWGWDQEFEVMAADPALRAIFVSELAALVAEYDLDGADIDWEYPDPGQSSENFLLLIQELRAAMPDKLLTTAVVAHGSTGEGVPAESFELFDFVNIMAYDGELHAKMEQAELALDYWQGRGLPAEKTVLGLPFYAEPNGLAYRKLVEADPQAAYADSYDYYGMELGYNGIPTVQAKTRLALARAGGVMFWTLEQDSLDEYSLLAAINAQLVR